MIGLASLVASLSLALAPPGTAQTPTAPDAGLQHLGTGWGTAASDQAVVLTAGELVAVAGGLGGSPATGAALSAALAIYCLTL